MTNTTKLWLTLVLLFINLLAAPWSQATPISKISFADVNIEINELTKNCVYSVSINNETALSTNCDGDRKSPLNVAPTPTVAGIFRPSGDGDYSTVIAFQQYFQGNACSQGPIWFISIKGNKNWTISEPLDLCAGQLSEIRFNQNESSILISKESSKHRPYTQTYQYVYGAKAIQE